MDEVSAVRAETVLAALAAVLSALVSVYLIGFLISVFVYYPPGGRCTESCSSTAGQLCCIWKYRVFFKKCIWQYHKDHVSERVFHETVGTIVCDFRYCEIL